MVVTFIGTAGMTKRTSWTNTPGGEEGSGNKFEYMSVFSRAVADEFQKFTVLFRFVRQTAFIDERGEASRNISDIRVTRLRAHTPHVSSSNLHDHSQTLNQCLARA